MTIRHTRCIVALLVVGAGVSLSADRVRLRSGKVVEGTFMGADSRAVRVLLDDGSVSEVRIEDAAVVEFSARKPSAPQATATAPAATSTRNAAPAGAARSAAPARTKTTTVPAGSAINVRLTQAIDVDASRTGQTFKAIVDDPVMVNGQIVIPRGASAIVQAVNVQQSGSMKGSDKISLKMHSVSFGGMVYEVTTGYVESKGKGEGKKTARKVGGGAGLGAIVGGIAGGGSGAAIGAAVGGVTGAAVAAGGEEHLTVPAETRLQFLLTQAVSIRS
jgi:hypothetical protein